MDSLHSPFWIWTAIRYPNWIQQHSVDLVPLLSYIWTAIRYYNWIHQHSVDSLHSPFWIWGTIRYQISLHQSSAICPQQWRYPWETISWRPWSGMYSSLWTPLLELDVSASEILLPKVSRQKVSFGVLSYFRFQSGSFEISTVVLFLCFYYSGRAQKFSAPHFSTTSLQFFALLEE